MDFMKNNCYECRYKGPGSAHSTCSFPITSNRFLLALAISTGKISDITIDDESILKFHPTGIRGGWCMYPINFDPVWVECNLLIEKDDV